MHIIMSHRALLPVSRGEHHPHSHAFQRRGAHLHSTAKLIACTAGACVRYLPGTRRGGHAPATSRSSRSRSSTPRRQFSFFRRVRHGTACDPRAAMVRSHRAQLPASGKATEPGLGGKLWHSVDIKPCRPLLYHSGRLFFFKDSLNASGFNARDTNVL